MNKLSEDSIEKFLKGKTSIEEEKLIKEYLFSKNIDKKHYYLLPYFQHIKIIGNKEIDINIHNIIDKSKEANQKKKTYQFRRWMPYAAAFLILIGISSIIYWNNNIKHRRIVKQNSINKAAQDAEYALLFLSKKLNVGSDFFKLKNKTNEKNQ